MTSSHRLIGVRDTDLKLFEGNMAMGAEEKGIMRRVLEKANRRFVEAVVEAPKATDDAGSIRSLIDVVKKDEVATVLAVRPTLKVRLGHALVNMRVCVHMCGFVRTSPSRSYHPYACRPRRQATSLAR